MVVVVQQPFSALVPSTVQPVSKEVTTQKRTAALDLRWTTIHRWAPALREGHITSEELARAALERIYALPASFVRLFEDTAVIQARAADIRLTEGEWRGQLSGIPVAVQDCFDVAWSPTEGGCPEALPERAINKDASIVEKLRSAGAVIMGKTHSSELGYIGLGYNQNYDTPLSPFGQARGGCVPGGSSGGSAVAVAEGLVLAALGSDTAGSSRIPAAWCGVTAFRPTFGNLPLVGCQPLSESFDSVGIIANCVDDCAMLHRLLQGSPEPHVPLVRKEPSALRLLVPIRGWAPWPGFKELDAGVRVAFEAALDALSEEGIVIDRAAVAPLDSVLEPFNIVVAAEAAAVHADLLADEVRLASLHPLVREQLDFGAKISATQYLRARKELQKLRSVVQCVTIGYNAVLMPTVPMGPPRIADVLANMETMREATRRCASVTRLADALERCAVTLPCHSPPIVTNKWKEGEPVPVGLMIMGEKDGDETCLAVAATIESALHRVNLGKWRPTNGGQVAADAQDAKRARVGQW